MMRPIYLIMLLLFALAGSAQYSPKADSLQRLLKNAPDDTMKFTNLMRLANELSNYDLAEAQKTGQQALQLAQKKKWKRKEMIACSNLGIYCSEARDINNAIKYHNQYFSLATELGDSAQIGNALYELSTNYLYLSEYTKSQDLAYKALDIAERKKDTKLTYFVYGILGSVFLKMEKYQQALEIYKKELALVETEGNEVGQILVNGYIGNVYFELRDSSNALKYLREALRRSRAAAYKPYEANYLTMIGSVYSDQNDYNKALPILLGSMKICEEIGYKALMIAIYIDIGKVYQGTGRFDLAEKYCKKGLELAVATGEREGQTKALNILSTIYESKGRYKEALDAFRESKSIRDSIINEEKKEDFTRRELTYEFGKKAAADSTKAAEEKKVLAARNHLQEVQLSRSRLINYGLIAFCILALAIAWLFIRQNRLQSSQRAMQLEQKLLRSQMSPHFIFNSLGAIESFIYENQPKEAGRYLSDFARLMRLILESSSQEYIPLSKEISMLEYYLSLQKLRYGERLSYTIRIDEHIDHEELFIPPMLSQPFIENALEHGLKQTEKGGSVTISFDLSTDRLLVKVEDNGIGIDAARKQNADAGKHQSKALQITQERLAILNRKNKRKVDFTITDRSKLDPGASGTLVAFAIPL